VVVVSGIGVAPKKATVEYYEKRPVEPWEQPGLRRPPIPGQGIRAAITPGVVDGLLLALENSARNRSPMSPHPRLSMPKHSRHRNFSNTLSMFQRIIALWPSSQQFYFPAGAVPKPGDIVHMPNLARTLREMAAGGEKGSRQSRGEDPSRARHLL